MKLTKKIKWYLLIFIYILALSVAFYILEADIRKEIIISDGAYYIPSNRVLASKVMIKYYLGILTLTVGIIFLIYKKSKFLSFILLAVALFFTYIICTDIAKITGIIME